MNIILVRSVYFAYGYTYVTVKTSLASKFGQICFSISRSDQTRHGNILLFPSQPMLT